MTNVDVVIWQYCCHIAAELVGNGTSLYYMGQIVYSTVIAYLTLYIPFCITNPELKYGLSTDKRLIQQNKHIYHIHTKLCKLTMHDSYVCLSFWSLHISLCFHLYIYDCATMPTYLTVIPSVHISL